MFNTWPGRREGGWEGGGVYQVMSRFAVHQRLSRTTFRCAQRTRGRYIACDATHNIIELLLASNTPSALSVLIAYERKNTGERPAVSRWRSVEGVDKGEEWTKRETERGGGEVDII